MCLLMTSAKTKNTAHKGTVQERDYTGLQQKPTDHKGTVQERLCRVAKNIQIIKELFKRNYKEWQKNIQIIRELFKRDYTELPKNIQIASELFKRLCRIAPTEREKISTPLAQNIGGSCMGAVCRLVNLGPTRPKQCSCYLYIRILVLNVSFNAMAQFRRLPQS